MEENRITIPKTARYFAAGNPETAHTLLYALHGYGQLAFYFLKKFEALADKGYFIVAPEGMHRFYLEGNGGRVGASWMTRESRETDISDNMQYLDALHIALTQEYTFEKVALLGFSQGGATAARWKNSGKATIDQFVLWASVFPEDVPMDPANRGFGTSENHFVLGSDDPYFSAQNEAKILEFYAEAGFTNHRYTGKHAVDPELVYLLFK